MSRHSPPYGTIQGEPPRRPSFARDVFNGAVRGDFARNLGFWGAATQAALGYVPGVGTACAARDLLADLRQRDRIGALLNVAAIFPILGGFPKTAEVIRHAHLVGRAVHKTHRADRRQREAQRQQHAQLDAKRQRQIEKKRR